MQLGLVPARCWGLPDAVLLRAGAAIRMGMSRIDAGAHQPSTRCGISASSTRNCKTAQLTRRHALPCPEGKEQTDQQGAREVLRPSESAQPLSFTSSRTSEDRLSHMPNELATVYSNVLLIAGM